MLSTNPNWRDLLVFYWLLEICMKPSMHNLILFWLIKFFLLNLFEKPYELSKHYLIINKKSTWCINPTRELVISFIPFDINVKNDLFLKNYNSEVDKKMMSFVFKIKKTSLHSNIVSKLGRCMLNKLDCG